MDISTRGEEQAMVVSKMTEHGYRIVDGVIVRDEWVDWGTIDPDNTAKED